MALTSFWIKSLFCLLVNGIANFAKVFKIHKFRDPSIRIEPPSQIPNQQKRMQAPKNLLEQQGSPDKKAKKVDEEG